MRTITTLLLLIPCVVYADVVWVDSGAGPVAKSWEPSTAPQPPANLAGQNVQWLNGAWQVPVTTTITTNVKPDRLVRLERAYATLSVTAPTNTLTLVIGQMIQTAGGDYTGIATNIVTNTVTNAATSWVPR